MPITPSPTTSCDLQATMVKLKLSWADALHTTISNTDDKPLYKLSTPYWPLIRRTTTIYKYILGADGQPTESSEEIARIQWHAVHNSKLVYQGRIVDLKTFMPAVNTIQTYVHYGQNSPCDVRFMRCSLRRTRVFTGPDGKSYRWKQGLKTTCWVRFSKPALLRLAGT